MDNTNNWDLLSFGTRQRVQFLEAAAFWKGEVHRKDIVDAFSISGVQASGDLREYLLGHPDALEYNRSRKRYIWNDSCEPKFEQAPFGEVVQRFVAERLKSIPVDDEVNTRRRRKKRKTDPGSVFFVNDPARIMQKLEVPYSQASLRVQQGVVRAVILGKVAEIQYYSLNTAKKTRRSIAPHAFGFDGERWFVRAFCMKEKCYKNFNIERIEKVYNLASRPADCVEWPKDVEWETPEVVRAEINPELPQGYRDALRNDYNFNNQGILEWKTTKVLAYYAKRYLNQKVVFVDDESAQEHQIVKMFKLH